MKKTVSLEELEAFVEGFISTLEPKSDRATVVALSGNLGAGKTTFTQHVCRYFNVTEYVTSPTFVIQKVYPLYKKKFNKLVHIDAYRLTKKEELLAIGWDDLVKEKGTIVFIEWPENVEGIIPESAITVKLDVVNEVSRVINISNA